MHVDELFETWRQTVDAQKQNTIGKEIQRYLAEKMLMPIVTTRPTIQAARDGVKGYVYMRGLKVSFETTWMAK
jgi:ABC-type transport system substrate-binding protein